MLSHCEMEPGFRCHFFFQDIWCRRHFVLVARRYLSQALIRFILKIWIDFPTYPFKQFSDHLHPSVLVSTFFTMDLEFLCGIRHR